MGLNLTAVREGLVEVLVDAGIRAYGWPTDAAAPPCVVVGDPESTVQAMGGVWAHTVPLEVMVQRVADRAGQLVLDDMLDRVVTAVDGTWSWGDVSIQRVDQTRSVDADVAVTVTTVTVLVMPV